MNSSHLRQDSPTKRTASWVSGLDGPMGELSRVPKLVWEQGMEWGLEGHCGPHPPPPLTEPDLKEALEWQHGGPAIPAPELPATLLL